MPLLPIIGISGGDFLTIGTNANGHPIDLGDGLDNLFLADSGFPTYSLELHNVEQMYGLGDGEIVNLQNPQNGLYIDLGDNFDTLNLANGTNVVIVAHIETVRGGSGDDTINLAAAHVSTTMVGGGGADVFDLSAFADSQPVVFGYEHLSDSPAGSGRDTIVSFDSDLDTIDLHGLGIDHWDVSGGVFHAYVAGNMTSQADLEIALPGLHGTDMLHPNVLI